MAIEELQGGRYRYERVLGSGGMGDVYLMKDTRVSRRVAIKVVRAEGSIEGERSTEATRLFQREARAIAALEHPNILPLYDFGEETRDGMAITYMVMPYCADGSLEIWLRNQNDHEHTPQQVACLIEQAAEALQYAHDHEVIHLDVKPSNFLLRRNRKDPQRPTLLLADFGIARNFTTVANSSRTIRGTPTSMAPEQWSGNPVFASDQYALAVMAYELLAGRPPFTGSMEQLMYHHFTVQAPPPSKFNPRLPTALDPVLQRALAKKPEERFPSIADFAGALVEAAQQPAPEIAEEAATSDVADYATQAISQEEAEAGISQLLTLNGEQAEAVPVAAGQREELAVQKAGANETPADVSANISETEEPLTVEAGKAVQASKETPQIDLLAPAELSDEHDLPTIATDAPLQPQERTEAPLPAPQKVQARRPGLLIFVSLIVVVALLAGATTFYFAHQPSSAANTNHITPTAARVTATSQPTATATPTPQPGLYIAGTYNGSMAANAGQQYAEITVSLTQIQGQGALSGSVKFNQSNQQVYSLTGKVDRQGNFSFTVQQPAGQTPLVFHGSFQSGSTNLKGFYCHSTTNSCQTDEGYFTVGPRVPPQ